MRVPFRQLFDYKVRGKKRKDRRKGARVSGSLGVGRERGAKFCLRRRSHCSMALTTWGNVNTKHHEVCDKSRRDAEQHDDASTAVLPPTNYFPHSKTPDYAPETSQINQAKRRRNVRPFRFRDAPTPSEEGEIFQGNPSECTTHKYCGT